MRIRLPLFAILAILLLGAASPSGCSIPWLSLLTDLAPVTVDVHVINKASHPADFSLITSTTTNAAATAPSTQPDGGGSTLDKNGQFDTTFPCTSIPDVLSLKATLQETSGTGPSGTSKTLHNDSDYSCGSDVTFTIRQTAPNGVVVGTAVK